MGIGRQSFAVGAEIGVMADGTLVAVASNVRPTINTKRTIAIDADMSLGGMEWSSNSLVDRNEAMAGMVLTSSLDASGTVIPIGAAHALIANTVDVLQSNQYADRKSSIFIAYLITSITRCHVAHVTSGAKELSGKCIECLLFRYWCKSMAGVMSMFQANVARNAKIVIFAHQAGYEVGFLKRYATVSTIPQEDTRLGKGSPLTQLLQVRHI